MCSCAATGGSLFADDEPEETRAILARYLEDGVIGECAGPGPTQCAFFKGGYIERFKQVLAAHGIDIW